MTITSTPAAPRARDPLDGRDAAVDGDDDGRTVLVEDAPDRLGLQAVAVPQPVREEGDGVRPGAHESGAQLSDGRDAVDVVVAEDDDPPPGPRRARRGRPPPPRSLS